MLDSLELESGEIHDTAAFMVDQRVLVGQGALSMSSTTCVLRDQSVFWVMMRHCFHEVD